MLFAVNLTGYAKNRSCGCSLILQVNWTLGIRMLDDGKKGGIFTGRRHLKCIAKEGSLDSNADTIIGHTGLVILDTVNISLLKADWLFSAFPATYYWVESSGVCCSHVTRRANVFPAFFQAPFTAA